eukprot:UN25014
MCTGRTNLDTLSDEYQEISRNCKKHNVIFKQELLATRLKEALTCNDTRARPFTRPHIEQGQNLIWFFM